MTFIHYFLFLCIDSDLSTNNKQTKAAERDEQSTSDSTKSCTDDFSVNISSTANSSDNSLLDFKKILEEDIPSVKSASLGQDYDSQGSIFQNINEKKQGFFSSSSFDSCDDNCDDYEDCDDYYENDQSIVQNESALDSYKKMSLVRMFPESQLSTRDVSLMIMAYSIRFHSTYEARDALFELCKLLAGDRFQTWNTSKYIMSQLYDPPDEVITLCFL